MPFKTASDFKARTKVAENVGEKLDTMGNATYLFLMSGIFSLLFLIMPFTVGKPLQKFLSPYVLLAVYFAVGFAYEIFFAMFILQKMVKKKKTREISSWHGVGN